MAKVELEKVSKRFRGGRVVVNDVNLEIADGEFLVFVGPSGCGKTTTLRMIAGLESVSDGFIRIGSEVVNMLTPRERDIAMVFQNYGLYPHMTVGENIEFPLKIRGVSKSERQEKVKEVASLLGLSDLLRRRPGQLSGGQRQRVAMGRAIVREPSCFLMDEPLSNLDAQLRVQMRAEVSQLQRRLGVTTIYVTHDQVEAMTMGQRVAVMKDGLLQQCGTPQELYRCPANVFVASFIGSPPMNLLWGEIDTDGRTVLLGDGWGGVGRKVGRLMEPVAGVPRYGKGGVLIGVRPEDWRLGGGGSGMVVQCRAVVVEELGPETIVHCESRSNVEERRVREGVGMGVDKEGTTGVSGRVILRVSSFRGVREGDALEVFAPVDAIQIFDEVTGEALGKLVA